VNGKLQPGAVGFQRHLLHLGEGNGHVVVDAGSVRGIEIGLEEHRGGRTQRAVHEALERANLQEIAAEVVAQSQARHVVPQRQGRARIEPRGQFALLAEFLIDAQIVVAGHVLDAGQAQAPRFRQRRARRAHQLLLGGSGNHAEHQVHGRVFQDPGRLAAVVAYDGSAGRVFGFPRDARQFEGQGIGQRHVPVVAAHEDRGLGAEGVYPVAARQFRRCEVLVVPIAAGDPLPLGYFGHLTAQGLAELLGRFRWTKIHAQ
jgi:hypothetical protein